MSDAWVTIATFDTTTEASIARNRLEAAGIRVFLADEATVGMAWHLGIAVGGIKLQVAEQDVERAVAEIESRDATPITEADWNTAETQDESDAPTADTTEPPSDRTRDETVTRAFRAAVFGLAVWPLQLYSLWLLLHIAGRATRLSRGDRRRALVALVLDLPILFVCVALIYMMTAA